MVDDKKKRKRLKEYKRVMMSKVAWGNFTHHQLHFRGVKVNASRECRIS